MTTNDVRDDSDRTPPLLGLVPSDHGAAKDGASDVNLERNRRSIAAWHQTRLNNIILEEIRKACVSRDDHRLMLKQLISTAYHKDPQRKANIDKWKGIMLAVEKEYVGANALFSISPDPYQRVLAKISSMMIWDGEVRHWEYSYCTEEIARRHSRHIEVLTQLQRAGKHFLNV
ncbi:hypothetical protein TcBrA4_0027750 [Trypanosoma cruzi]|nr:hypothetical protein TcBrA4_0027750 [Trypanosoma cruzi]